MLIGIDPKYKIWLWHGEPETEPQNSVDMEWEEDHQIDIINNVANDLGDRPHALESLKIDSELPFIKDVKGLYDSLLCRSYLMWKQSLDEAIGVLQSCWNW